MPSVIPGIDEKAIQAIERLHANAEELAWQVEVLKAESERLKRENAELKKKLGVE